MLQKAPKEKKKKATGKTRSSTIGDREYATCMEREGKKKKKSSNEKHKQQAVKLYKKMVKKDRRYEVEE